MYASGKKEKSSSSTGTSVSTSSSKTNSKTASKTKSSTTDSKNGPFNSCQSAAEDFATNYNDDSIRLGKEMGATVYEEKNGEFYYPTPNIGGTTDINMYTPPLSSEDKPVALVHTHGSNSNGASKDEEFSRQDIKTSDEYDLPIYVATPSGNLMSRDPGSGNKTTSYTVPTIPSDSTLSDSERKTKVDASKGDDNPYVPLGKQVEAPVR